MDGIGRTLSWAEVVETSTADFLAIEANRASLAEREWPTAAEVCDHDGLCDKVCPAHNRRCAQPHVDDIGHACVFCTTEQP